MRKRFEVVKKSILLVAVLLLAITSSFTQDISQKEYAERRAKLESALPDGVIILSANKIPQSWERVDAPQLLDFYYLTGLSNSTAYLALVPAAKKEFLFVNYSTKEEQAAFKSYTNIEYILPISTFDRFAQEVVKGQKVYVKEGFSSLDGDKENSVDKSRLQEELIKLRLVKSEAELKIMRKAIDITREAHELAMKNVKPNMNEGDLQKIIEDEFARETGTHELAFPCIVGSGVNSTTIHYTDDNKVIEDGDIIVCDIGVQYKGYAADLTRTFPANGKFSDEQKKIYQIVLDTQKLAERHLKPGITLAELHKIAKDYIAEKGYGKYFPHGLSHFVGLATHDSGNYNTKLAPGMVITIEPGIYIKDKKIGVRIEDDYVVTEDGFERMSKDDPREIDEIEKMMKKNTY